MHSVRRPFAAYLALLLPLALLGTGCDKPVESTDGSSAPADVDSADVEALSTPEERTPQPDDVLVKVDGKELTRQEVQQDVEFRLNSIRQQIPPDRIPEARQHMYRNVIEQFAVRELLLAEAERRDIAVTEEDRSNAYARIAASLPEGMTVEEALTQSPMGEQRMRQEVEQGLTISKLLEKEVSNTVSVTAEAVAAFREENAESLTIPEQVGARHILIGFEETDDEATKAEKLKQAEDIRTQLQEGADFAEMAKEHSTGPSAPRGGDLGTFGRGQMVKEFDEAVFSREIGEIGPVVETQFGYHVIEVTSHEEAGAMSDEQVEEILQRQSQRDTTGQLIERLKSEADIEYADELQEMGMGMGDDE